MATLDSPNTTGVSAQVDQSQLALRTSQRPLEYTNISLGKTLGHYRVFVQLAAIAPAANAVLAALRWTDSTNYLALLRAWVTVTVATAVTAQRTDPLVLTTARGYTIAETTNATAVALPGTTNQKMRSSMGASITGSLLVANAAAGLTGGTKTSDANPIGAAGFGNGPAIVAVGTGMQAPLFDLGPYSHPNVLGTNEGILVSWGTTALATGTVVVGVGFELAEVPAF